MEKRVKLINQISSPKGQGPVVYWMNRDMRLHDNWAVSWMIQQANKRKVPAIVAVALRTDLDKHFGTSRMLQFLLGGLMSVEKQAKSLGLGFEIVLDDPTKAITSLIKESQASELVADFSPLSTPRRWKEEVSRMIDIPFWEVDAHNIIPAWSVSPKQEFAAYTIRPKIHRLLDEYLELPDEPKKLVCSHDSSKVDWVDVKQRIKVKSIGNLKELEPGPDEANGVLKTFVDSKLENYFQSRNDPTADGTSNLSPYLHFGHISVARVAHEVTKWTGSKESKQAFLEELIVRRELAENFCYYNPNYRNFSGFPQWAQTSLDKHRNDEREVIYTLDQLERAQTHDPAWNAAQSEMVKGGKMHGYMRMYWAKKILEWTESPEQAMEFAIYLNDLYELDGRDPNGYTGIAWSIGGVHDRPWFERPVFGQVRYMNYNGLKRKFDVDAYIKRVDSL